MPRGPRRRGRSTRRHTAGGGAGRRLPRARPAPTPFHRHRGGARAPPPETSTFDGALGWLALSRYPRYTTEIHERPRTENRRHNIHTAADLLNNSARADGGGSGRSTTRGRGERRAGFGRRRHHQREYDDAVGGGICQVATTVQCGLRGGLSVTGGHNHRCYISELPRARRCHRWDPDLVEWERRHFGCFDALATPTSSSLIVTLYNPGYVVSTDAGGGPRGRSPRPRPSATSHGLGTSYVKLPGPMAGRSLCTAR